MVCLRLEGNLVIDLFSYQFTRSPADRRCWDERQRSIDDDIGRQWLYHSSPQLHILHSTSLLLFHCQRYTVWVKKVAPPLPQKTFCNIFTCGEPVWLKLRWLVPKHIAIRLHQFWSIYLDICVNYVTFSSKTPQILANPVMLRDVHGWGWPAGRVDWSSQDRCK